MSINHIVYDIVPEDEKLDVKFKNVYCDQVITGDVPTSGDGYVDAVAGVNLSSPTTGVSFTTFAPSYSTGVKNHSTFIWTFRSELTLSQNLTDYYVDARIPDAFKTYFDAHPTAFSQYLISVMGGSNTIEPNPSYVGNQYYYADDLTKQGTDTVRIHLISGSNNGTGYIPNVQKVHLQLIFSGPAV